MKITVEIREISKAKMAEVDAQLYEILDRTSRERSELNRLKDDVPSQMETLDMADSGFQTSGNEPENG